MTDRKYYYSEVFHSIQGEGHYTGIPTLWLRFFLCNLQCNGFGQMDPTDPDSWVLPYQDLDLNAQEQDGTPRYKEMKDLPVFEVGCDSSYSWSKKFKGLQHQGTPSDIVDHIYSITKNEKINHNHMCFTGGEPLMKHAQEASVAILQEFHNRTRDFFPSVTFETNGTQQLGIDFVNFWQTNVIGSATELFFSISPKLFTVSGEEKDKAIKPENVREYYDLSHEGQLKFVVNGRDDCWRELELTIEEFRDHGVMYPIWLMNCGATVEGQQGWTYGHVPESKICEEAIKRGWNYSSRVHTHIFGNQIGT